MLNNRLLSRPFKDEVYGAFAHVTKALASPRRLELVDLLVQGPRTVEALARGCGQPVATASQHLQVLKRARLVQTERRGTSVAYRLAPGVAGVFAGLRRLAMARSPELSVATVNFYAAAEAPETIDAEGLKARLQAGEVVLLDVRPKDEFARAHLPGAISIPIGELEDRVVELPAGRLVVATCRGPFCTFAADAVRLLRSHGHEAVRFEHGVAEWAADGGRLASEEAP
jgi:rhodanese-related sulfurtransferase